MIVMTTIFHMKNSSAQTPPVIYLALAFAAEPALEGIDL